MARCPPPRPARCPGTGNPPQSTCLGDNGAPPHGTLSPADAALDQDRVAMPPPPPRPISWSLHC